MVGTIANLNAALRWDLDDFDRGAVHITDKLRGIKDFVLNMGDAVAAAGRKLTIGVTAPLAGIAAYTVKVASDAGELQSAFDYTFGAMAESMNSWAESTGNAMGRAKQSMQEGALALGVLFNQAAPNAAAAASLSQQFTELAVDAESFFNVPFNEALEKIRSGLTGEAEPLRKFGVFLSEAKVEAKALEMGLIKEGQELNENGKIMVRAAVIAAEMNAAKGDAERTAGSLANQVRSLKEELRELIIDMGQRLEPIATRMVTWLRSAVQWFKNLPESVKDGIIQMAAFAAAAGPVLVILSTLAAVALPLFLTRMGPVFAILTAIINPVGAAVVMLVKLAGGFGAVAGAIARVVPLFARLAGPVGLAITLLSLFGDNIARGFSQFFRQVSAAIGPAVQAMFAAIAELAGNVSNALAELAASPIGQRVQGWIEVFGKLIEILLNLMGYGLGVVISGFATMVTTVIDLLNGLVVTATKLLSGDWVGAWNAAVETVGRAVIRIGQWVAKIWPWLGGMIQMLGQLTGASITAPKAPGSSSPDGVAFGSLGAQREAILGFATSSGGSYAEPEKPGKPKAARAGRRGPTEEELQARREEIRLEQALAVARERNDFEAIRNLERERDLQDRIERYRRAGLDAVQARLAAEADMAEMDAAREDAQNRELARHEREQAMDVADLRNDAETLRNLQREEFLEDRILYYQREGLSLAEAQRRAGEDLLAIDEARADALSRRLADQEAEHQIELARMRGDSDEDIRRMEEAARIRRRTEDLVYDGMSEAEAREIAMREGADRAQAHVQGTFRDAFRNGLQAAMNGDLKGFFENWLRERSFNALAKVLDRLADGLAGLISGGGGGGGFFGSLISAFGIGGTGGGWQPNYGSVLDGVDLSAPTGIKGFATGGSFRIKGFPGIDQNLLSLNGNPVARVSDGEIVDVMQGQGKSERHLVEIVDTTGLFVTRVNGQIAQAAPGIAEAGAQGGAQRVAYRNSRRVA